MGALFAFREGSLLRVAAAVAPLLATRDEGAWRKLWPGLALAWDLPVVLRDADLPGPAPAASWLPGPHASEHQQFLRALARSLAASRTELQETKWHVTFPELSDEEAGCELGDSDEYEALGQHVFTAGAMPAGLEFLAEPNVATNWVSAATVKRLWDLERTEGLLLAAGSQMNTPLGRDFLNLRALLQIGQHSGWALYLWDPGS
ncbi:MAG: hypothetical protein AB7O37_09700 [Vicinamibacteria bacterium]